MTHNAADNSSGVNVLLLIADCNKIWSLLPIISYDNKSISALILLSEYFHLLIF